MIRLKLKVNKAFEGKKSAVSGVLANIYNISEVGKKAKSSVDDISHMRDLLVPFGEDDHYYKSVELNPGSYFIEVRLPSGQVVSDRVTLKEADEGKEKEFAIYVGDSPHEWLDWQQLAGNVEQSRGDYEKKRLRKGRAIEEKASINKKSLFETRSLDETRGSIKNLSHSEEVETQAQVEVVSAISPSLLDITKEEKESGIFHSINSIRESNPVPRGMFFQVDSIKQAPAGIPINETIHSTFLQKASLKSKFIDPNNQDELSRFFRLTYEEVLRLQGDENNWDGKYKCSMFTRQYLFVRGKDGPLQYGVLPLPWIIPESHSDEVAVEILLQEAEAQYKKATQKVSITVQDPETATMIGYLGAGDMYSAETVFKHAQYLLFEKLSNPIAAAAGGYILLSGSQLDDHEKWHEWIGNLMRWFPWLPDGAIQYAWIRLRYPIDNDLSMVRTCLLEAFCRGLPFYSKGVAMLRDGLTICANDAREKNNQDKEVEYALQIVQNLALRTNPRQPFTTVTL